MAEKRCSTKNGFNSRVQKNHNFKFISMSFFQKLFGGSQTADLNKIIQQGAFLVDIRTPAEFAEAGIPGAVNIPLDTIASELSKFRDKKNIIVFCRTGNRSGQAKVILEQNGFTNVSNGGSWENVNQFIQSIIQK